MAKCRRSSVWVRVTPCAQPGHDEGIHEPDAGIGVSCMRATTRGRSASVTGSRCQSEAARWRRVRLASCA